jgi:hypothetical protein
MPTATAFVDTSRPQRYIKQPVSHFGNKVTTKLTDGGGRLEFDLEHVILEWRRAASS